MSFITVLNNQTVPLQNIPVLGYAEFTAQVKLLLDDPGNHCVSYFGYPVNKEKHQFFILIADDSAGDIKILSYELEDILNQKLDSITKHIPALHIFEREIHENFGIQFTGHPWLKPVRYSWNRPDKTKDLNNYPFYRLEGHESHEVGVGPIHAGVIEPGHFRFSCIGENVHHLEIHLGYQHRGIEHLFLTKKSLIQRFVLAESITGDKQ